VKIAGTVAELLILLFVTINCYVNVAKYISDKRKNRNNSEQDS